MTTLVIALKMFRWQLVRLLVGSAPCAINLQLGGDALLTLPSAKAGDWHVSNCHFTAYRCGHEEAAD